MQRISKNFNLNIAIKRKGEREKEKCVTEFGKLSNKLRIKLLRTNRMIELVEWNELPSLILYIETIYKHQNNRKKE